MNNTQLFKKTATSLMDHNDKNQNNQRRLMTIIFLILFILILLSILGATVFRARNPVITVNNIVLRNFDVAFNALRINVDLNISLEVDISVFNPNRVGLKYRDSAAFLEYRGQVVGQAPIPAGRISAGQTMSMYLTLTVMADRFLRESSEVANDVLSGTLLLTTRTTISGKVNVIVVKINVVSYAVCDMSISVASKSLLSNNCKYDTRIS